MNHKKNKLMKTKFNLRALLLAVLLIAAGSMSPSNSIDDGINKSPLELIVLTGIIAFAGLVVYLLWNKRSKSEVITVESGPSAKIIRLNRPE